MDRLELEDLRNRYMEIYNILSEILLVNQFKKNRMINDEKIVEKKKSMDLIEMNEWLLYIVEFYKKNGIDIDERDFRDTFPSNSISNRRINETINRYMKVFFENINDLSNKQFNELVLHGMNDLGVLADTNPVIDEIVMAVNKLNSDHKNIFNHIIRENINKKLEGLNIGKVEYDTIDESIKEIEVKILELDKMINEMDTKEENDNKNIDKDRENYNKLNRLCMLITGNKYEVMSQEEKSIVVSKLPMVIDMIIKLRIFDYIKDKYLEYSNEVNYNDVLKEVLEKEELIKDFKEEFEIETKNMTKLESKKGLFKGRELRRIKESIVNLGNSIVRYNNDVEKLIGNYLEGFYNKYDDISRLEKEYNISGMEDNNKLFGVFDFRKLPPSSENINELDELRDVSIRVPDVNSIEFKEVSGLSLELITLGIVQPIKYMSSDNEMIDITHKR